MNHLDEGTIHAWIDGALDAARSREIEAHVAQCASCSAAVAEARGLVAGASRILNALDDVPAGVLPKGVVPNRAVLPRRRWRAAPWVTGIAAALVLAIGLGQWNASRRSPTAVQALGDAASALSAEGARPESVVAAVSPAPISAGGRVAADAASRREARGAELAKTVASRARESNEANTRLVDTAKLGAASAAADSSARDVAVAAPGEAAKVEERANLKASVAPPSLRFPAGARLDELVVTGVKVTAPARRNLVVARGADDASAAGCYRVDQPRGFSASAVAGAVVERAQGAARAPAQAPAPSRAQADFASEASAPAVVRLDTAATPLGFRVKAVGSDSSIGWWREVAGDSVRADLLARGVFAFARKDRIACP